MVVAPEVVVVAVVRQGRADREENRALQRKFQIRISTFEKILKNFEKIFFVFRMADPANKTFEDFERSTQSGGQSECPLGYGNEPQPQQVTNLLVHWYNFVRHPWTEKIMQGSPSEL